MKNTPTATTPSNSDVHSGPTKTSANPTDATSTSPGTTPASSSAGASNVTPTAPLTTSTPKPATTVGNKVNAANDERNTSNNNTANNASDTKAPGSPPSNGSGTGIVTGGSKPANYSSQAPTPPVVSSRPPPPSRPPPSTPTTQSSAAAPATTTGSAATAANATAADNKDGKRNSQAESGVRKSLIERFSFLSRSKEANLDGSGTGSNTGPPSGQAKPADKSPEDLKKEKEEKEKKEKEEKEDKKRKKEEEKKKKEEEKKRKKEEEQERKRREKEEKIPLGLETTTPTTPGREEAANGMWDKSNVMEIEACRKVKSNDPGPNATTVVQWSPGSFRPRAMRSGVYIVNDPRSNRVDANSPTYNGSCPQSQLKKMGGDSVNVDMDDPMEKSGNIYRSALTKLICCLYALIIIALGVVFSTADALTAREREHKYYLEVFLIYLYVMSLAILLYFHVHLLRGMRNTYFEKNLRITIRRSQDNLHKSVSNAEPPSDDNEEQGTALTDTPTKTCSPDQVSTSSHASSQSHLELPAEGTAAHVGEGINFYLRLGCLAFSLGSVALDGFHIATYFETESTATCESPIFPMVYVVHLLFVFVQTFFVFKNHKLVINKSKALVRFGLMHLLATNLCIWSSTAIAETAKDYRQQEFFKDHDQTQKTAQGAKAVTNVTKSCFEDVTLARVASPYLFPCTIMYSLIASGIIHRMYLYVGVKVKQKWPSHMSLTSSQPQSTASMDCEKANRGLFLGLLIGVITLIAIATFFVFEVRISDSETAIKVFFITEIALLVITTIGVILGYLRLSTLRFRSSRMISLDSILLIIALSGTYVYLFLLLISSASGFEEFGMVAILSVICICMELVQLSVQAVFLLDGLCRSIKYEEQQTRKPGRAIVTFLLVCNLALWSVSSFEVKKTTVVPLHERFFGLLAWNIIIHLCLPLLVFIRFHSVICLSEIWYDAYQKDKDN